MNQTDYDSDNQETGFFTKLMLTSFALGICFLLYKEIISPNHEKKSTDDFPELVLIDPVDKAKELKEAGRFSEAAEYLDYFTGYEYVYENPEFDELNDELKKQLDSWGYQAGKCWDGIKGDGDGYVGNGCALAFDATGAGDARDLYKEIITKDEKDRDYLLISLATVGLVDTIAGIASVVAAPETGGASASALPTIAVIKDATSSLKIAVKKIKVPSWLKTTLINTGKEFEPIVKPAISKMKIFHPSSIKDEVGTIADGIRKLFDKVHGVFLNVEELYKATGSIRSTSRLIEISKDIEHLKNLTNFAKGFGNKTFTLLEVGGNSTIHLYESLGSEKKDLILGAATFGKTGVRALKEYGEERFVTTIRTRMTKFEKQLVDSGVKAKVSGRNVVKRDHLFDPNYVHADNKITNVQRMEKGLSPIGHDGKSLNLHHIKQENDGLIAEVGMKEHISNSDVLHRYKTKVSDVDHGAGWNKFRSDYWKERAKDFK